MSNDIRYLNPVAIEITKSKYCRFKKSGIKFLDYKDANYLLKLVNEQGKILPRRATGVTVQQQRQISKAIKRARALSLLPFVAQNFILKVIFMPKSLYQTGSSISEKI